MRRFEDRTVIVTGAANGIGSAAARRFAAEGAAVLLADVDAGAGANAAAEIRSAGGDATFVPSDVTSLDDWRALTDAAISMTGRLDVVHNNAYVKVVASPEEMSMADWQRQLDVCLTAVLLSVKSCIRYLRESRGAIVNTSSCQVNFGVRGHPAYAAAKGAICSLSRQLAVEYAPLVRVNTVIVGAIATPSSWGDVPAEEIGRICRRILAGRLGAPDELAAAVCFLASADASYITGQDLIVDGGYSVCSEQ